MFNHCVQSPEASANPADFVRASMSVPIFFQPFTIPYIDSENKEQGFVVDGGKRSKTWTDRNDFQGEVPSKAVFCDGKLTRGSRRQQPERSSSEAMNAPPVVLQQNAGHQVCLPLPALLQVAP